MERYGRQMLQTGPANQERLASLRVVVVGAGGIGCACLAYLAGAGVGHLIVCDGDAVEVSNLHRQHLHSKPGANKAQSAAQALRKLNTSIRIDWKDRALDRDEETLALLTKADAVCDCTDNVDARYMLNDGCYAGRTKLYSASALGLEGSLTNFFFDGNACYRCMYPRPTHEARRRCGDSGVVGPVPGALGALQALEVIADRCDATVGVFDGFELKRFRKPKRRKDCEVCGEGSVADFFGRGRPVAAMPPTVAFPPPTLATVDELRLARGVAIVDVRQSPQFEIQALPGAVSAPLRSLQDPAKIEALVGAISPQTKTVYVVCRRGVDSRVAASVLRNHPGFARAFPDVRHVVGGLEAWRRCHDPDFALL